VSAGKRPLARVEAQLAVRETLARYCHTIDADDADAWLDCFTEDACWTSEGSAGGPSFVLDGRAALAAWFAEFRARTPIDTQAHLVLNERVSIDGDHADATSTFAVVRSLAGEPAIVSLGLYRDRLARCDDGVWRIETRTSRASLRRT
jgi:uncharacterized protein (TIGR02246 family)